MSAFLVVITGASLRHCVPEFLCAREPTWTIYSWGTMDLLSLFASLYGAGLINRQRFLFICHLIFTGFHLKEPSDGEERIQPPWKWILLPLRGLCLFLVHCQPSFIFCFYRGFEGWQVPWFHFFFSFLSLSLHTIQSGLLRRQIINSL